MKVLCGESEEDLRAMVRRFAEVCRRGRLKVNADKSKVMVLNREEGLECEVQVDKSRLEHVSEFKYAIADLYVLFLPSQTLCEPRRPPPHNILLRANLHFLHSYYPIPCAPGTE